MLQIKSPARFGVLMALSILVGIITGLASFALYYLTQFFTKVFLSGLDGFEIPRPAGEIEIVHFNAHWGVLPLFLIPALGGLIVGIVAYTTAPETAGGGAGHVIESFHKFGGFIRARVPVIKTIISAITIGSGGSAGKEGPITQIGGGIGSTIANIFRLSDKDRRILVVSGMAGGIGSVFLAPMGGAFFGVEVLYKRDYEVEALIPAITASIVAYTVLEIILCEIAGVPFGHVRIFNIHPMRITSPIEFITYAILGTIAGLVGYVYIFSYQYSKKFFKSLGVPDHVKPAIGGLIVGIMGVYIHQILGTGYGFSQMVLTDCERFTIAFLLLLTFMKIFATTLTVGSGGSGGLFAPSLVIGSFLGGAVGLLFHYLLPNIDPKAYALVGMAAFLAGVTKTPLTAIILVPEITGSYALLPATMIASVIAYMVTGEYTLYTKQVPTRIESPAHRSEMLIDLLEEIAVEDAMVPAEKIVTVSPENTASDVLRLIEKKGYIGYPVVEDGKLIGVVTFEDVEKVPVEKRGETKVRDIMTKEIVVAHPDEDLRSALARMVLNNVGRLLVVSKDDPTKLLGLVTKGDIMRAYEKIRREQVTH